MCLKPMTVPEILEAASMAETYPGSRELNWGEIGWKTLEAWVHHRVSGGDGSLVDLDICSIQGAFERWWKARSEPAGNWITEDDIRIL